MTVKDTEELRLMIAREGKSLRDFSGEIGISQTYLSQILNGDYSPSPKVSRKISEGLNVEIDDIFLVEMIEKINHKRICNG
ncbi:helix-turn-helix domain-containing protein [Alteribacillus bidgolensis]|uniref:Putative transcriptional regulator n=1 Tax=Alteribacillus bidgolensis TaxID=930129 RepID=A0A1G8JG47_9BACI|nr:helix-turn-helix transcriptional regulator [Alteribacillus bidgolensis]SDI30259.1 putative transcriptional regulator [Alteribacillus bidgolensis]